MKPDPKAQQAAFDSFISGKKILIADSSGTARAAIANVLISMGVNKTQISLVNNYTQAKTDIEKFKPQVVIADYDLGKSCGLDLLQKVRSVNPEMKNSLFVLVTGNTSQSAVAKAAEEDVDNYIIKPFTAGVLRASILKAVMFKMDPPEYFKALERGKAMLAEGSFDEALKTFEHCKTLDPAPSLACFYSGQAQEKKTAIENAANNYNKGLEYNKIHYKNLVGLFDNLMNRKMHVAAYDVIKKISQYFPANPQRMTSVLRLAIMTKSYEDVERYYRIFTNIDERNEEMIKYVCAALVVCGKYYLQQNFGSRAIELFQKAAITASGRTKVLREIILALLEFDMAKEASEFLNRFPPDTHKGVDYLTMSLAITDHSSPRSLTIEKGRELLKQNFHDPVIYKILIKRSAQSSLGAAVEELMRDAVAKFPDQKAVFDKSLATANTPQTPPPGAKK